MPDIYLCGMCSIPCTQGAICCAEACADSPTVFPRVITLAALFNVSLWHALAGYTNTMEVSCQVPRLSTSKRPSGRTQRRPFHLPFGLQGLVDRRALAVRARANEASHPRMHSMQHCFWIKLYDTIE